MIRRNKSRRDERTVPCLLTLLSSLRGLHFVVVRSPSVKTLGYSQEKKTFDLPGIGRRRDQMAANTAGRR